MDHQFAMGCHLYYDEDYLDDQVDEELILELRGAAVEFFSPHY
jgi:hypothetical protein